MPTPTPRLGLDDYDPGETDWDHSDLVQFVEEHAVERDTFANRPASGEYDGEPFLAEDRRILYRWDAASTSWEPVTGMGTADNPLPGTVHRESLVTDDLNNAKQVAPDADFSGIQSVLDGFAATNGWNKLELHPDGEYAVDTVERLEVPSHTVIDGNGAELVGNGDESTDAHLLLTNADWTNGNEWIIVRDLVVDGTFTAFTGNKDPAYGGLVQFTNCDSVYLENAHIQRGYRHCFQWSKCTNSKTEDCVFEGPSGDDPYSVSDGSHELGGTAGAAVSHTIHSVNDRVRNVESPQSGFEVDDGPSFVYFIGSVCETSGVTGFSVKTHPNEVAPKDIYLTDCRAEGSINVRTNASTADGEGAKRIYLTDCHVGNTLYVGAEDVFVRGGDIANSSLVEQSANTVPTVEFDGVHFSGGAAMYCIEVRDTNRFKVHNCDMLDLGNQRGIYLHPDGVTLSGVTVAETEITHAAQDQPGIEFRPVNTAVIEAPVIRECTIENSQNGIRVRGTSANYSGLGKIVENTMRSSNFNGLWFSDDLTPRQHIITRGNYAENFSAGQNLNASSQVPAAPTKGVRYLDDGTNTASANPGDRYYDGTAWVDFN